MNWNMGALDFPSIIVAVIVAVIVMKIFFR